MNKEQFIAIGLSEDLADKAAAASTDELKSYIPKTRFDEVNTAKKTAEDTLKERDKQLEALSKDANASDELKAEITRLQGENKTAKEQYETDLKDMKLNNAITAALNGKVHNEAVVTGLINKDKLVIGDDGKVVGLDEQLTGLKTSDAYLFKPEDTSPPTPQPGFKIGSDGKPTPIPTGTASLLDAVTAHYQTKQ